MFKGKIIDSHAHIFPEKLAKKAVDSIGDFYGLSMDTEEGTVEALLADGEKNGITKYVVHSTATVPGQVQAINDFIHSQLLRYPQLIGYGTLHPQMDNPKAEIDRMEKMGFKGIKLHPDFQEFAADSPEMFGVYSLLAGRFPVLFHAGDIRYPYSNPHRIAAVAKGFPELTVIAAHFGGYSEWDSIPVYEGLANVYFDTCSALAFLSKEEAVRLIRHFGAERFLFGSDFPMWAYKPELERMEGLKLTKEEYELIFYKNIQNLLHL